MYRETIDRDSYGEFCNSSYMACLELRRLNRGKAITWWRMSTFTGYSIFSTTTLKMLPPEPDDQSAVWPAPAAPRLLTRLLAKLASPVAAAKILEVYIPNKKWHQYTIVTGISIPSHCYQLQTISAITAYHLLLHQLQIFLNSFKITSTCTLSCLLLSI